MRSLAADLGIAAGTVARAYKELEAAGVVEPRGATVPSSPAGPWCRRAVLPARPAAAPRPGGRVPAEVLAAVDRYIELGRSARLADDVLLDLLRGRLRKAEARGGSPGWRGLLSRLVA